MADSPSAATGAGGSPAPGDRRQQQPQSPNAGTFEGSPGQAVVQPPPPSPVAPKNPPERTPASAILRGLFQAAYTAIPELTPPPTPPPQPQFARVVVTPEHIQEKHRNSPGGVGILSRFSLHVSMRDSLQRLADSQLDRSDTSLAIIDQIFGSRLEDALNHSAPGYQHLGTQCSFVDREQREYFTGTTTSPYNRQTQGSDVCVLSVRRARGRKTTEQEMPMVKSLVMLRRGFVPLLSFGYNQLYGQIYTLTPAHPAMKGTAADVPSGDVEVPFTVEWLDSERDASSVIGLKPLITVSQALYTAVYNLREKYSNDFYAFLERLLLFHADRKELLAFLRYLNYPRMPLYATTTIAERKGG